MKRFLSALLCLLLASSVLALSCYKCQLCPDPTGTPRPCGDGQVCGYTVYEHPALGGAVGRDCVEKNHCQVIPPASPVGNLTLAECSTCDDRDGCNDKKNGNFASTVSSSSILTFASFTGLLMFMRLQK